MTSNNRPETRLATRLSFIAAGFATACWAPIVPFAKRNVGVDDAGLGLLLLCIGIGSVGAMPLTGWLCARIGSKPPILAGGFGMVVLLPFLATAASVPQLAVGLFLFGASLGMIDVAVNIHAVEVERDSPRPMMSGFHAMYSVGGFAGAGGLTALLSLGLSPLLAALAGSLVTIAALLVSWPRLLSARGGEPMTLSMPRGIVLLLAGLAAITFLVEGAILDWGALLIVDRNMVAPTQGGIAYMLFAIAMTVGRLFGDRIVTVFGGRKVLIFGGLLAISGFVVLLGAPVAGIGLAGFILIGLGASNIVPVLFSLAGRQDGMPAALAISAVTTAGYGGILMGPALLGFVAHQTDLSIAFGLLALLLLTVPLTAGAVTRAR